MVMRLLRVAAISASLALGCYIVLSLRTMGWGASARSVAATLLGAVVFVLPLGTLACVSRNRKRMLVGGLLICLAVVALCEATATLEEQLFRRRCAGISGTEATVFKDRWWPFEHHYVYYDSSTHTFGGGD